MSNLDELREALRASPDNVPLLLMFAGACADDFLAEESLASYERVLALEPGNRRAKLGIARVFYLTGRNSEAAVRLESLLRDSPDDLDALRLLSRVLLSEGSVEEARQAYLRTKGIGKLEADPDLEAELGNLPSAGPATPSPTLRLPAGDLSMPAPDEEDVELDETPVRAERPGITFEQVGGMEPIKEEIRQKILHPLQNPELYKAYGKSIGGGVLLFGPPGCGKTHLSHAVAGETGSRLVSVGLHEILDLYVGNSEKALHGIFEIARDAAPCTLFFDEVDAIAASRTDLKRSAGRTLVNQFLLELDGGTRGNEGILVIGATNAPWHMDSAFLRPGRFDRVLFVPPPDEEARVAILEILVRDRPCGDLDLPAIARKTSGFSGADLRSLVDQGLERCLAQARKKGAIVPLTTKELAAALHDVKPSTRSWFETAKNYALYANAGGLYDGVLDYLGIRR